MSEIADAVNSELNRKNITMRELSKLSGVPYSTIQRFLSGENDISSSRLILILNVLQIDIISYINGDSLEGKIKSIPNYLKASLTNIFGG